MTKCEHCHRRLRPGQVFNIGGPSDFVVSIRPQQTFLSPIDNSGSGTRFRKPTNPFRNIVPLTLNYEPNHLW